MSVTRPDGEGSCNVTIPLPRLRTMYTAETISYRVFFQLIYPAYFRCLRICLCSFTRSTTLFEMTIVVVSNCTLSGMETCRAPSSYIIGAFFLYCWEINGLLLRLSLSRIA